MINFFLNLLFDQNEAKALLALHINAFLAAHIDAAPEDQIQESQAMLQADYSSTQEILRVRKVHGQLFDNVYGYCC